MSTAVPTPDVLAGYADPTVPRRWSGGRADAIVAPSAFHFPALSQLSLPGSFSGSQGRTLSNMIVTALACGLWVITLLTEVGGEYEAFAKRQILGFMTIHIAISLAVLLLYIMIDAAYIGRLLSKNSFVIAAICVAYVFVIGLVRQGNTLLFREECYAIRWFAVGFMLMRIVMVQKGLRFFLVLSAIATTILLYTIVDKATSESLADTSVRRVTTSNMWPVAYCSFITIGLMLNAMWPMGTLWQSVGLTALTVSIVVGSVRTSTRSLFAVQAALLILTLLALAKDPRMAARQKWLNRLKVFVVAAIVLYVGRQVVTGRIFASISLLSRRFLGEEGTGAMRLRELYDMFASFGPIDWVFGGGLGSYFVTELGWWTARPHIAFFTWLQKGGVLLFVVAVCLIYVKTIWAFIASLTRRSGAESAFLKGMPRPILVVGPPLIAWLVTTVISGGFDNGSMLALGGLTALWIEMEDESRLLKSNRYRGTAMSYARAAVS